MHTQNSYYYKPGSSVFIKMSKSTQTLFQALKKGDSLFFIFSALENKVTGVYSHFYCADIIQSINSLYLSQSLQ